MNIGLVIAIVMSVVILVGLIIWAIIIFSRDKKRFENDNVLINFMPQYTNGYALGGETLSEKTGNDKELINFIPKDVDVKDIEKGNPIEVQKIAVEKNKVISLPYGCLSRRRTIKFILPPSADDFPPEFKEHPFGQLLIKFVEDINAENVVTRTLKNRINVENKLLNKTDGGERIDEYLDHDEELNTQISKKALENTKSSQPPRPDGYPGKPY